MEASLASALWLEMRTQVAPPRVVVATPTKALYLSPLLARTQLPLTLYLLLLYLSPLLARIQSPPTLYLLGLSLSLPLAQIL
jgi:hypothetical protein